MSSFNLSKEGKLTRSFLASWILLFGLSVPASFGVSVDVLSSEFRALSRFESGMLICDLSGAKL